MLKFNELPKFGSREWLSTKDLEGEVWKDVIGYENLYQVSCYGRIKSLPKYIHKRERILKGDIDKDGYVKITLCPNSKERNKFFAHRAVAFAFIGSPKDFREIDHIDGNPQNNCVNNLRWVTHQENIQKPITIQRKSDAKKGCTFSKETLLKMRNAKLGKKLSQKVIEQIAQRQTTPVAMIDEKGIVIRTFPSMKDASLATGVNARRISDVCLNKRKKAGGFIWKKI